jgi:hypothetical protein
MSIHPEPEIGAYHRTTALAMTEALARDRSVRSGPA